MSDAPDTGGRRFAAGGRGGVAGADADAADEDTGGDEDAPPDEGAPSADSGDNTAADTADTAGSGAGAHRCTCGAAFDVPDALHGHLATCDGERASDDPSAASPATTDIEDLHLGALAETTAFSYAELARGEAPLARSVLDTVRDHPEVAAEYREAREHHERADAVDEELADLEREAFGGTHRPDGWAALTLADKLDALERRRSRLTEAEAGAGAGQSAGGGRGGGTDAGDEGAAALDTALPPAEDPAFYDGGQPVGTLAALDAAESAGGDADADADGAPDFATALDAVDGDPDQLPSLQVGLAHLVEDVAIHAVEPPAVRAAVRAVRGGTDPSGAALRFLDAVTLDEPDDEPRGDAVEADAGDYTPRSRVGVNYAGQRSRSGGGPADDMRDEPDDS